MGFLLGVWRRAHLGVCVIHETHTCRRLVRVATYAKAGPCARIRLAEVSAAAQVGVYTIPLCCRMKRFSLRYSVVQQYQVDGPCARSSGPGSPPRASGTDYKFYWSQGLSEEQRLGFRKCTCVVEQRIGSIPNVMKLYAGYSITLVHATQERLFGPPLDTNHTPPKCNFL